jgi:peroxiredoxin
VASGEENKGGIMTIPVLSNLFRRLGLMFASGAIAVPAVAAVKEGDRAPEFTAQASLGGKEFSFSLKEALAKGPVVVYFYPSAYTPGCNVQAHTFSVDMDKFSAMGASVIGISLDSIERLNDFSKDPDFCAGKVAVASDVGGKIAKSYGVAVSAGKGDEKDSRGVAIGHSFAQRITYVVAQDGKIASIIGGIGAKDNVERALAEVQKLKAAKMAS